MAKGKYEKWLEPENLVLIEGWARDGLTDEQIAHNMGIRRETLYSWMKKYNHISNALKKGKEVADRYMENALYKAGMGWETDITKEKVVDGEVVELTEHVVYPPNVTAAIFWLKNRKPEMWRDRKEQSVDVSGIEVSPISLMDVLPRPDEEEING